MSQLLLIAAATFASEDLTCIATGALIASGQIGFLPGVLACIAGIYFGDLLLYFAGRVVGRPIVRWKPLRGLLTEARLDGASEWLANRGAGVVILSRFTPGLRLPTYVAAGILKTRFWTFALYFLLAAVLWTPALVGAAALLGKSLPHAVFVGPVVLLVGQRIGSRALPVPWHLRRRLIGWWRRKTRWEFWPPWLAYLPVVPCLIYLGIRHRSLTLFTAANPGIPSGGFVGESKSAILAQLTRVPRFRLLPAASPFQEKLQAATHFSAFPLVLKPDVGERGSGVAIVRSERDVRRYLEAATGDIILQEYVAGLEFGIFYYRLPGEPDGRIFSITAKHFPEVVGDGRSTLCDLVLRDERAVCLANLYLSRFSDYVPAVGARVPLVEIGSHCRGAIFLNAAHFETEALRKAIDEVAKSHDGFHFGRFDVRTSSIEALRAGCFQVLELNGVSAEATHIYDPSVSLIEAYRVFFHQWRLAFAIGALNKKAGAVPITFREFLRLVRQRPTRKTGAAVEASAGRHNKTGNRQVRSC